GPTPADRTRQVTPHGVPRNVVVKQREPAPAKGDRLLSGRVPSLLTSHALLSCQGLPPCQVQLLPLFVLPLLVVNKDCFSAHQGLLDCVQGFLQRPAHTPDPRVQRRLSQPHTHALDGRND